MRKTPSHNPNGLEKESWNYRVLQLRHALGWSQEKIAGIMGIARRVVKDLESGEIKMPRINTIRAILTLEHDYKDILTEYKKAPERMSRLNDPYDEKQSSRFYTKRRYGVKLKPIEVRRPEDLESLGKVEDPGDTISFGRSSRKRMQQAGMPVWRRERQLRIGQASARRLNAQNAARRIADGDNPQVQSGQPNGAEGGTGGVDQSVRKPYRGIQIWKGKPWPIDSAGRFVRRSVLEDLERRGEPIPVHVPKPKVQVIKEPRIMGWPLWRGKPWPRDPVTHGLMKRSVLEELEKCNDYISVSPTE